MARQSSTRQLQTIDLPTRKGNTTKDETGCRQRNTVETDSLRNPSVETSRDILVS